MDFYNTKTIEKLKEDDIIDDFEEGFMQGYLSAYSRSL